MSTLAVPSAGPAPARDPAAPLGVYVHVPFCATRCDYCDFATWTDRGGLIDDYVAACVVDLQGRVARGELGEASTGTLFSRISTFTRSAARWPAGS